MLFLRSLAPPRRHLTYALFPWKAELKTVDLQSLFVIYSHVTNYVAEIGPSLLLWLTRVPLSHGMNNAS